MVFVTIRILPFVLTVVLIFSVTLFVSTLGVRSYSDQRYSSMQISTTKHSSRVSTGRTAGCGYSFAGSDLNRDTSRTGVSGGGVGRESGKGTSTAETPARTKAVSREAGSTVAASGAGTAADATASVDDTGSVAAPRSAPPQGTPHAGTRQDRLSAHNRSVQGKKAAGNHFSKTCCPITTRVSINSCKTAEMSTELS